MTRQCSITSYYEKKKLIFMKIFEQNGTLCLEFWGKTRVEAIKFW